MDQKFWITGLVAATFTPLHADKSINFGLIPRFVDQLIEDGIGGLYVCGSTGEGVSFTTEERTATAEAFITAVDKRIPVVVQVGHNSLAEARYLAERAAAMGADAISATPPTYFKPNSVENLLDCLGEITASAPGLPFYYYHIPSMTGVPVPIPQFLTEAAPRLSSLAGVKFSHPAVWELQNAVAVNDGQFNLLFGVDEMLLSGLCGGAQGAVGSTYNFAGPLYKRIIAAFETGDLATAQALQGKAAHMVSTVVPHGGNPALKAVMALLGLDCGPCRLPQISLAPAQIDALGQDLDAIGFFDWAR